MAGLGCVASGGFLVGVKKGKKNHPLPRTLSCLGVVVVVVVLVVLGGRRIA